MYLALLKGSSVYEDKFLHSHKIHYPGCVHSWAEFGAEGTDYPRDSEEHVMYLDYCDEMGIPQSFYWYTLEAASAEDIHYMTSDELVEFRMLTIPSR